MSNENIFRVFMDVVNKSSSLRACASRYNFHSRITKNLLDEYEYHQFYKTRQEKKPLMDTNNHNQNTRWSQELLGWNHSKQPYTNWELLTACQIRVLCNIYKDQLKSEYGIPKSTLKRSPAKVCPPLQWRNAQHIHQMLKKGEVLRSKVLEIIKMSI